MCNGLQMGATAAGRGREDTPSEKELLIDWENSHVINTLVASEYKDPSVVLATGKKKPSYGFYPQMKTEGMAVSEEKSTAIVIGTNPGYQNGVIVPKVGGIPCMTMKKEK